MSEGRFLVIHFNGKWDDTSYVGGSARAFRVHDEHINFSTITGFVSDVLEHDMILKRDMTTSDYQIFKLVNVDDRLVKMEIRDDKNVEFLFSATNSPELYVSLFWAPFKHDKSFMQMMMNTDSDDYTSTESEDSSDDSLNYASFENGSGSSSENDTQCACPCSCSWCAMEIESGDSNFNVNKKGRKFERKRRSWSPMEEDVLIEVMKELIITKGWKFGNGCKPGYLNKLEAELIRKLPATDLRASPHIKSKITMWKKRHISVQKMLSEVGVRVNSITKKVICNDYAWKKVVKKCPNVDKMRCKLWHLDDWNVIFGKDCVTGKKKARLSGQKRAAVDGN